MRPAFTFRCLRKKTTLTIFIFGIISFVPLAIIFVVASLLLCSVLLISILWTISGLMIWPAP